MIIAGIAAMPSVAMASTTNINVDCDAPIPGGLFYVRPESEVTFTSTNCSLIEKNGSTLAGSTVTVASSELLGGATVDLVFRDSDPLISFTLTLVTTDLTDLEPLVLGRTDTMTIPPLSPASFAADRAISVGGLGGDSTCTVDQGEHPFQTADVVITAAGNFIFRVVATSPDTSPTALRLDSKDHPLRDSFLAIYRGFDPVNPNDNLIACNDDSREVGFLDTGVFVNSHWSRLATPLTPGDYTLVLTTFDSWDTTAWSAAANSVDQSAVIQMWGTLGAFAEASIPSPSTGADPTLAATGGSVSVFPIGVAVALLGFCLLFANLTVRRTRRSAQSAR